MRATIDRELDAGPATWLDDRTTLIGWGVIAAVAAVCRFLLLDRAPLSEPEATQAVQAWQAARGLAEAAPPALGTPLLTHLTTALFFIFGPSDFAARVVPALAGVGLAFTPWLLADVVGRRAALAAAVLLAVSPVAIQVGRMQDPASLTVTLTMLVAFSAIRLALDRPWWAPWSLAAGIGLSLANEGGSIVALAAAALAAAATWGWSPRRWATQLTETGERRGVTDLLGPLAVAAGFAIVAATGAFMDLSGVGFILGEVWGNAARVLLPAPFPTRNLAALLAYGWPILILAFVGFLAHVRDQNRLALFLGQWSLLLAALAAVVGQSSLMLALAPLGPAVILAGMAIADLWVDELVGRATGSAVAGAMVVFPLLGAIVLAFSQSFGAGRSLAPLAIFLLLILVVAVGAVWRVVLTPEDKAPAIALAALIGFAAITAGSIARLSYGGSLPGAEPLPRETTNPAIRGVFADLNVLAGADSSRVLLIDGRTPETVRWYGRWVPSETVQRGLPIRPITVREPTTEPSTAAGEPARTPLRTVSLLNRGDLNPLGVARWVVARYGLVQAKTSDIIISR